MRPHNVLFLDLDGVLHREPLPGEPTIATAGLTELLEERPDLCEWSQNLADTLQGHACELVLHSSWRAYMSDRDLRSFLPRSIRSRLIGATPRHLEREESIVYAVQAMKLLEDEYLVVDDEPELFSELRHRLVVCNPMAGVATLGVAKRITAWLEGPRTRAVEWK